MRKRLEILEEKVEKIYDEINGIEFRLENLTRRKKRELKSILEKYIDTYDGFEVKYFSEKVSVYVKDSNYSLLDMYVYDEWKSDSRSYNRIDFSTSSFRTEYETGKNMKWAAERFQLLAFYSKALSDFMDDILAEMNVVRLTNKKEIDEARTEAYLIEASIKNLKDEINTIHIDEAIEKLEGEGLIFNEKKAVMDIKWDWTLRGINSAKIVSKTASGKSCNIEIQSYDSEPRVFENIRMSNVDVLLRQYRDTVINA